jgi:hypothetical protein
LLVEGCGDGVEECCSCEVLSVSAAAAADAAGLRFLPKAAFFCDLVSRASSLLGSDEPTYSTPLDSSAGKGNV